MNLQSFAERFPDPAILLELQPDEIGFYILEILSVADNQRDQMLFIPGNFWGKVRAAYDNRGIKAPDNLSSIFDEGLQWLLNEGLLAYTYNANNTIFVTRKGKQYEGMDNFKLYALIGYLSPDLLHKKLRQKIYPIFTRGDFDTAVFQAFKEVEVLAREQAGLSKELHGKTVFEQFFSEKKLPNLPNEYQRRDRGHLISMFTSSYNLYRNPPGHRNIDLHPEEAVEMIMLANHLLRILDNFSHKKNLSEAA